MSLEVVSLSASVYLHLTSLDNDGSPLYDLLRLAGCLSTFIPEHRAKPTIA